MTEYERLTRRCTCPPTACGFSKVSFPIKVLWFLKGLCPTCWRQVSFVDNKDAIKILNLIDELYENPQNAGEPLEGKFKGKHRIRIGDYRVIYWIKDDENTVYIISVGHRKDVYKGKW